MKNKLSIIIPVYNEEVYIHRCLENIIKQNLDLWEKEIIIVNDGSTDNTLKSLKQIKLKKINLKIFNLASNRGKGAAIKKGIAESTGDILLIQDADLEYDPEDYTVILEKYKDPKVEVVYGSRILGAKIYHNYSANVIFLWGGLLLTRIVNWLFALKLTDQPTGYKSWRKKFNKELTNECKSKGFEYEIEMTALFSRRSKIHEVPIRYYPRTVSHGKKIRLIDFIKSLIVAIRCRLFKSYIS
ncbi:MAG: Glycosyl transferase, family 2 [Candidatus Roizmanbacteria bacterium GW2011_GWA2_35_8]|uniref:Glycosyl transferase, family 2 n=1 Tax=Candidatus Roizmanbacteria bacterium GW2011_GWA2_35_8 TaxID=1618479 RepID=A0A0G0D0Q1_9BACT|nr:MAG: Glycosyl transferase, family 2 [Candidatus Roizmanbacteria bacterium GW2011_GWA2_35_8]